MATESDRLHPLYLRLLGAVDALRADGEASEDDVLEICCELYGRLLAGASFLREDTREQYEHRIARAKEQLESTIHVHSIALRRVSAELDAEDDV